MSETPDEEVDYGPSGSIANPLVPIQIMHGVHLRLIAKTKSDKGISFSKTKRVKISSQYMKECKP